MFDAPGAFELPLMACDLAATARNVAVVGAALVVVGIDRHDFGTQAAVDGLMRAGLEIGGPVLSVSLTLHHDQNADHDRGIF